MDSIRVTTQELEKASNRVHELATDYMNKYKELYQWVDAFVTTDYVGDEGDAFREQIAQFEEDFLAMKQLMDQYGDYLKDSADTYDRQSQSNIDTIRGLQN